MQRSLFALAGALFCGGVAAFGQAGDAPPKLQPIAPGAAQAGAPDAAQAGAPDATHFAALAYFQSNCARCHGPYGSFYGDTFGKNLDDKAMHDVVDQMAKGPANAPLDEHDLKVLVAWHRALRDQKPFVEIVKAEKSGDGWTLSGEVSPGASLQINGEAVEVDGSKWTHLVKTGALKLRAQSGDAVTELEADGAAFSP